MLVALVFIGVVGAAVAYIVHKRQKQFRIALCDGCSTPYKRRSLAESMLTRATFTKSSDRRYLCPQCAEAERMIIEGKNDPHGSKSMEGPNDETD
ncbi:MAG: hypothetical protein U1A28_00180 [Patescibacteria group bacterium]|nr:hypothetical protein [Patescibacteria group bacterium]